MANRDGGRAATRAAIDNALTANNLDAIMTPSGTLTGTRRARRLPADRRPGGLQRHAAARSASPSTAPPTARPSCSRSPTRTSRRRSCASRPSEINPAVWRCVRRQRRARCAPGKEVATGVTLDFPLETASVAELQADDRRHADRVQLTKAYLQRIALTNTEGPSINAVRALNPKALEEAPRLDAERAAGNVRGPLHGIP